MKNMTLKLYVNMQGLRQSLGNLFTDNNGQDLIEYALVVALIAFAATVGMSSLAARV